jgi:hypothetical protein
VTQAAESEAPVLLSCELRAALKSAEHGAVMDEWTNARFITCAALQNTVNRHASPHIPEQQHWVVEHSMQLHNLRLKV